MIEPRQLEALVITANLVRALGVIWYVLSRWSTPPVEVGEGQHAAG